MTKNQEPSTPAAGGTPWKGRLRSHPATPQSTPSWRRPSHAKNRGEAEEAQASKKRAPKNTRRGGRRDEDGNAECKARDNQSSIRPLRRSPRFHTEDINLGTPQLPSHSHKVVHNRKTQNASRKDKKEGNRRRNQKNAAVKPLPRMTSHKDPQLLCQSSQDMTPTPRQKIADISRRTSEKKDLRPSHSEVMSRKRKRGSEGRSLSKRQSYRESQSLPPDCQEIAPSIETRKLIKRKSEKDSSLVAQPKIGDKRLMNAEENSDEPCGIEREGKEQFCAPDCWTKEQDMALRQAYFTARPSPHFWKRVSKMVPGRSAEECFNRIHADLSTPTPMAPRPRKCKAKFSPLGNFSLSDPELPNLLEPTVGRQRTSKRKSLAAQKTVRHLLQKHCLIDQAQEADHFSIFESSPSALQLNISFEDSPGNPHSYMNSDSLRKCSASSSARKKPFSRLKTKQDEPSPAVLKPVKNVILHEKYIDQLSRREGTKRPRRRTPGTKAADSVKAHSEQQDGDLKAAKNALISEATDFISHFKKSQANSLVHVVEHSEDDEIECDTSDDCHDDEE